MKSDFAILAVAVTLALTGCDQTTTSTPHSGDSTRDAVSDQPTKSHVDPGTVYKNITVTQGRNLKTWFCFDIDSNHLYVSSESVITGGNGMVVEFFNGIGPLEWRDDRTAMHAEVTGISSGDSTYPGRFREEATRTFQFRVGSPIVWTVPDGDWIIEPTDMDPIGFIERIQGIDGVVIPATQASDSSQNRSAGRKGIYGSDGKFYPTGDD